MPTLDCFTNVAFNSRKDCLLFILSKEQLTMYKDINYSPKTTLGE